MEEVIRIRIRTVYGSVLTLESLLGGGDAAGGGTALDGSGDPGYVRIRKYGTVRRGLEGPDRLWGVGVRSLSAYAIEVIRTVYGPYTGPY